MKRKTAKRKHAQAQRSPAADAAPHESAAALRTVVETVRSVMRADTASVASFSLAEHTVTWKALSGFSAQAAHELVMPLNGAMAEQAAATEELLILAGIGQRAELPADEFPLHSAEGVRDVAIAPLRVRGETLGALVVGYRAAHSFILAERQTLKGLAEMAALALDNTRLLEIVSASKRLWEQTFDAIPDGIIVHDAARHIVRCNATAADALNL